MWEAAADANAVTGVHNGDGALGCDKELIYMRNVKPGLELVPDVRP